MAQLTTTRNVFRSGSLEMQLTQKIHGIIAQSNRRERVTLAVIGVGLLAVSSYCALLLAAPDAANSPVPQFAGRLLGFDSLSAREADDPDIDGQVEVDRATTEQDDNQEDDDGDSDQETSTSDPDADSSAHDSDQAGDSSHDDNSDSANDDDGSNNSDSSSRAPGSDDDSTKTQ